MRRIARLLHALGEPRETAASHARPLARRLPDGPRGERLVILEHRERMEGGGDRAREAWVLRAVFGWSERDAAKALDCSRTALRLHLEAGTGRFDQRDVQALRLGVASLDAPVRVGSSTPGSADSTDSAIRALAPLAGGVVVVILLAASMRWLT